jgi:thiamine pyrophosphokinase
MDTILVFAGGDHPDVDLSQEIPSADLVMAADSGYDAAVSLGYAVDVLVGDLDSIGAEHLPGHVVIERHPRDKDQTDLDLALELAMRDEPHRVVVVGGSGGRLDHELATASLICDERWSDVEMDWVSSRGRAHVIRRHRTVHGDVGATVSLLAVGGPVTGLTTRGLRWELNGARFEPGSTWGVSNVMQAPVADIRIGSGCLLVVFPE